MWWDPTPSYTAVAAEGAALADVEQLEAVAGQRIFFGHMSVGRNILDGLDRVYAAHEVDPPPVIEIAPGESPDLPQDGLLVHALIGENRHPVGKLKNFDATLRAGLGEQVDVAALKFCYIDIRWNSDVEALFARYQNTLSRLESDYPDVRFVHLTVPLTTGPYGIRDHLKILAGRDDNATRERYNELMRQTYGNGELFDLAKLEATDPEGVLRAPELFSGYSSDGAHLNTVGSERLAAELVGHLADVTP
ncbi:hypothetical protein BJF81_14040 [Ornithinimicrobium sp. CNJ-824]|uniref:SGNH/GDSL hydrolase family protein n=1 Tax=Ornithinimicrobium sp. CNJ-824 TaxID=1904966 RepID=UPI00095C234D|nr:SGNH/GDSL hydrolase family protein [Ornithinimicrobium sp. CNJ-824]OLT21962.1 hypothetical protein BJF81_14040 [Ornithinimicrobium sp. CNJ-824]